MSAEQASSLIPVATAIATSLFGAYAAYLRLRGQLPIGISEKHIEKQFEACEAVWLAISNHSAESTRLVVGMGREARLDVVAGSSTAAKLGAAFGQQHGLYLSRSVRKSLFSLKGKLEQMCADQDSPRPLSREERIDLEKRMEDLRAALRDEVGTRDLRAIRKHS